MSLTIENLFSLDDKVIVITGGNGYLGSMISQGLIHYGATVVVADVAEKPSQLSRLHSMVCDVSNTESIQAMFSRVKETCRKVDVLVNCATYGAGYGPLGTVDKMSDEDWQRGLDGAIGTVFRCTREVIPYFEENGGGNIVNIASMYGLVSPDPSVYGDSGANNPVNYGAGKAAVIQFTKYCAAHYAKKNIRANCITPGAFPNTELYKDEEFLNKLRNKSMLGRLGKPIDLLGPFLLLTSDASSYMTGSNIVIDGGWTAW